MQLLSSEIEKEIKQEISATVAQALAELKESTECEYLKKYQVCELINVSNVTLDKLVRKGLPQVKVMQNVIRYNKREVLKWIQQHQ